MSNFERQTADGHFKLIIPQNLSGALCQTFWLVSKGIQNIAYIGALDRETILMGLHLDPKDFADNERKKTEGLSFTVVRPEHYLIAHFQPSIFQPEIYVAKTHEEDGTQVTTIPFSIKVGFPFVIQPGSDRLDPNSIITLRHDR